MKICPRCATQSADDALFCTTCGTSLKDVQSAAAVPVDVGQPEPEPAPEPVDKPVAAPEPVIEPAASVQPESVGESVSGPAPDAVPQPEVILQPLQQQYQQDQQQNYQQQYQQNYQQYDQNYQQQYQQNYQQYDPNYQQQYQQNYQQQYQAQPPVPPANDHTADFDAEDISSNKVVAMAAYLLGTLGVIIAFLTAKDSPYASFHARQSLKLLVVEALVEIISLALFWTIVVPIAGVISLVIILVIRIICFFYVAAGKAKDAPIIGSFPFLK